MNIKVIVEVATHSTALRYWLLLIPFKTAGSYTVLGLIRAYLAKQARKLDYYLSKTNGYSIVKLSCSRADRVFYLTYYIMMLSDVIQ